MDTKRLYVDFHVLQTVPPSCVNRDDTGSPKTAVYGGAEDGVKIYIEKIGAELADAMEMCGVHDLKSITREMIRLPR